MERKILLYNILLLSASAHKLSEAQKTSKLNKPTVILVSFDGFRWDYMNKTQTPNLDFIASTGVKAKYITNAFVTKTFPNHYTIVTGLYEESHGIVSNTMYDPTFKSWFFLNNTEAKWWNGGEPVWVTNQLNGGTSAVVFWPGSEVAIRGVQPSYFKKYDGKFPYNGRVDEVVRTLDLPEPPTFLAMYFEEPDHSGHLYGPDSQGVKDAIKKVDTVAGYLIEQLKSRHLLDKVNLIFTSDHGMTNISDDKLIYLEDYIPPDSYTLISAGSWDAFAQILPKDGWKNRILKLLKDVPHISVYSKENIPTEYHYKNNRRVTPVFAVGEEGWSIVKNRKVKFRGKGNHGYSNKYRSMSPFFVARGPYFRENYVSEPFKNVDIYPMLCDILGIKPARNNGSLDRMRTIFRNQQSEGSIGSSSGYTVLIVVILTSVFVLILMSYGIVSLCCSYRCRMREYGQFYDLGTDFDL